MSRLITLLFMLTFSGAALTQGAWRPYTSTVDGFQIQVPGQMELGEIEWESEYGIVVPARIYSHEDSSGSYTVTVVDYTDAQALHEQKVPALISVYGQVDVRGSVAYAATKIRQRAREVTYDAYHYISRIDGHQLQTINLDGTRTYAAMYLLESKLYIVDATVNPGSPPGSMFQQSMNFVDGNGDRVNFRNFEDVTKVSGVVPR